ncbi:hypothetical protein B0H15DRAFT_96467 [Mycena belliarum]|uniref:Uncharacterized protein n=1 Tax=Mycena belliarum TaxID=1033014 RepID=A0AAD6XV51_9AGAR|nr:hypothetical protein B0H15DRAFT_96467 [Mycena belliae]
MSARLFTLSALRCARPTAPQQARLPRRNLFGFGAKPQAPAPRAPPVDEAELAKTKQMVQEIFRDKPDAVNAIIKFTKVMEESGVAISTGQMPGPMQLLKLASNTKFREAYAEVEAELKSSGVDIRSKEFVDEMMKLAKQLPRGP